jgi:Fic family protein
MMDHADMPRQSDIDGRGNLSEKALGEFVLWFLQVCLDQVTFMTSLFDLKALGQRLRRLVEQHGALKPEAAPLLEETLLRGEIDRGEATRITGLPERTARRVMNDVIEAGLLASDTPKGALSLRFPASSLEVVFPRLYPQS